MISIKGLSVKVDEKSILSHFSLDIMPGTVHALMGPNGSGKSTLASVLMGFPSYTINAGNIFVDGKDIIELSIDERARCGIFVAFQHPMALPGVSVLTLLQESYRAVHGSWDEITLFLERVKSYCELLGLSESFLERNVNEQCSGGEKKKLEMLQLLVLKPKFVILDEIDSGLDIDALCHVARAVAYARTENPSMALLLITHYKRILDHVHPDFVHVLINGSLAESGTVSVVHTLEKQGYDAYRQK